MKVLIVKYGEIALRGKNRGIYENMLLLAVKKNLADVGDFFVRKEQGRFVVEARDGELNLAKVVPRVTCVFGVVSCCGAVVVDDACIESIRRAALDYTKEHCPVPATFKVATKRADKGYPMKSDEISADVGGYLLDNLDGLKVKLTSPDFTLKIEIRNRVYIYSADKEHGGPGGLPAGSAGASVLLLSGGIDSPVAGYLAAKRGVALVCCYFHSPPYTSERAKEKVVDLARRLGAFAGKIRLYVVPFTDIQLKLVEKTPPEKITILLKRSMLRIAERIGKSEGALALITGDSLGQVASQTLHSLHAMTGAARLPIIRPLVCFDKHEITALSQKIGTYDISIRPFDDCCTLFLPKHPETKPKLNIIESVERNIDVMEELIARALADAEVIDL